MDKESKEDIENKILSLFEPNISKSIATITKELQSKFNIKISPQTTKRYILKLLKEKKILKEDG